MKTTSSGTALFDGIGSIDVTIGGGDGVEATSSGAARVSDGGIEMSRWRSSSYR